MDKCRYYDKCVICQLTDCNMHGTAMDANEHLLIAVVILIEELVSYARAAIDRANAATKRLVR